MSLHDVPVDDSEPLARTTHDARHVRNPDQTLKPVAFLPFKWVELSVIWHRELSEVELWAVCDQVAHMRSQMLVGRGDLLASHARVQNLDVVPDEQEGIPLNHANIIGWPGEKPAQMMKAIELAAKAKFKKAQIEEQPTG